MRKVLFWIGMIFVAMLLITLVAGWMAHEPEPTGRSGPAADSLAREMLEAINMEAWDSTAFVQWTFGGRHQLLWDKQRHFCRVRWDGREVLLDLKTTSGKAWKNGQLQTGKAADKMVKKAWAYFANDSFWLNAPAKAFDPGTTRSIVPLEDGGNGLLVHYASGGVTPGDSYLWMLDETHLPREWKMWVSVLPIGGVAASWEDWVTLETGAKVATVHEMPLYTLEITDVKGAASMEAFGLEEDPFAAISQ